MIKSLTDGKLKALAVQAWQLERWKERTGAAKLCSNIHTDPCTHTCTHTHAHTKLPSDIHIDPCTHTCTHAHTHMCTHVYTCEYTHTPINILISKPDVSSRPARAS